MRITECARDVEQRAEFWHGTLIVTGVGCHYTYALYLFVTSYLSCQLNVTSVSNIFSAAINNKNSIALFTF